MPLTALARAVVVALAFLVSVGARARVPRRKAARPTHATRSRPAGSDRKQARERERSREHGRSPGEVVEVGGGRTYLIGGRDEGLGVGMSLPLRRGTRSLGSCKVVAVGDHRASCEGGGARPGDRFALPHPAPPPVAPTVPPNLPGREELDRRKALVMVAVVEPHPFKGRGGWDRQLAIQVGLGHTSWLSTSADFHQERLELLARGIPLFAGIRANVDALVTGWSGLPAQWRFPQKTRVQVYVRELALTYREPGSWLSVSAGRVFPFFIPGVPMFDGAQVGWRSPGGEVEAGAFGGFVPDPIQLKPGIQRVIAGAYVAANQVNRDGILRRVQEEARVAYVSSPEYGRRFEAEARARAWFGRAVDVGAWLRFGAGGAMAPGALDGARLDVQVRAGDKVRIGGGVRYTANTALDLPTFPGYASRSRTIQSDFTLAWQALPWLVPAVSNWVSADLGTRLTRDLVGPEVALPRLFGRVGGMSLGYLQELEWMRGRSAYVQTQLQPASWFRSWIRLSYFEQSLAPAPQLPAQELGLYLNADFFIQRWLALRISALGRLALALQEDAPRNGGGWVNAGLTGTF